MLKFKTNLGACLALMICCTCCGESGAERNRLNLVREFLVLIHSDRKNEWLPSNRVRVEIDGRTAQFGLSQGLYNIEELALIMHEGFIASQDDLVVKHQADFARVGQIEVINSKGKAVFHLSRSQSEPHLFGIEIDIPRGSRGSTLYFMDVDNKLINCLK